MNDGSTSGFLIGVFDMLNIARLSVVEQVRGICDVLVIAVLSDEAVHRVPRVCGQVARRLIGRSTSEAAS